MSGGHRAISYLIEDKIDHHMKLLRYSLPLFLLTLGSLSAFGQSINFSEHIAPIIYDNCAVCHRAGEIGPMPLTSYEEVSNWGFMVQYVTEIKYMPPWPPDREYSHFLGERGLTDEEIELIAQWVDGGMPQGDPALEPELPDFPTGSQVGEPDLVLSFDQAFVHQGNNQDRYQIFVLPTGLTEDKVVKAVELRPGNKAIVHHALFAVDDTGQGQELDAETPDEYGYLGFGGYGFEVLDDYPGYVPGAKAHYYPQGLGQPMPAGSDLLIQMHYAPVPIDQTDSSTVNLFFAEEDEIIERYVQSYVMLPFFGTLTNGPFIIPANQTRTFHGTFTIPYKISLLGLFPHMHLLGQDWEVFAVHPNGDTTNLISIPEWDFNWQGSYFFDRFVVLEPGTELHAFASYDNTTDNPLNPNNPPKLVSWGEGTADEMFYLPFIFVNYQDGDEEVVIGEDGTITDWEDIGVREPVTKLYPIYPNPTNGPAKVGFSLAQTERISVHILDLRGQLVREIVDEDYYPIGEHILEINQAGLPAGTYIVQLHAGGFTLSEKLVVAH